jgi:hypothetical protein
MVVLYLQRGVSQELWIQLLMISSRSLSPCFMWIFVYLVTSWLVSNRMFTNGNRPTDVILKTMHFCSIGSSLCRGIKNRHLKCLINIRFSILQACRSRLKGMIVVGNSLFWRWDNSLAWVRLVVVLVCWPLGVLHFVQGFTSLCLLSWSSLWSLLGTLYYPTLCVLLNISFNGTLEWLNVYGIFVQENAHLNLNTRQFHMCHIILGQF